MKHLILFFIFFCFSNVAYANCNFPTGDHIEGLSNPRFISSIDIEIKKSSKYFKNAFSTILSRSKNIPPKLKKRFKASVKVNYQFGSCEYAASVRQHGDWKDHIKFIDGGKISRSLDVRLDEGNVLNSVRFKLLIPETRNGTYEVLASLILREAGFISPETFEVYASVNGVSSLMLFQENSNKELLERNHRREGPIFEGDETLLWSYENYKPFELDGLALSRMENVDWFKKGISSQQIVLEAFAQLQDSYLNNAVSPSLQKRAIFPNQLKNQLFVNYNYLLMAMNGSHALTPHNQKFYFNAIEGLFEPIYYDGNIRLDKPLYWRERFKNLFPILPTKTFTEWMSSPLLDSLLFEEFGRRVVMPRAAAEEFLLKNLKQFRKNQKSLQKEIFDIDSPRPANTMRKGLITRYKKVQQAKGLDQIIITKLDFDNKIYHAHSLSGEQFSFTPKVLANLLGKNTINTRRAVYLAPINATNINRGKILNTDGIPGKITTSDGIIIDFDRDRKIINFAQTNANDWVLMSDGDFNDWQIIFHGVAKLSEFVDSSVQRFNNVGLTGCLTIYNSTLDRTSFNVDKGGCEDSLNIISSEGKEVSIFVGDAYADAVDFDFSDIHVNRLEVQSAGNDCYDASYGNYSLNTAFLINCADKAISVGERSIFAAKDVLISQSVTALAVKDLSTLTVSKLLVKDVSFCGQAYQKKQEFGGAVLSVEKSDCLELTRVDENSNYFGNQ